MNTSRELDDLSRELQRSRSLLSQEYRGLLHELDFPRRMADSVKRHPLGWIGGAVSAGLMTTLLGFRGRRTSSRSTSSQPSVTTPSLAKIGWIAGAVEVGKILLPVVKPFLLPLVTGAIGRMTGQGLASRDRVR